MILLRSIVYLVLSICLVESIIINTRLGKIKGVQKKSRDGRSYYAFTRVPFAKPPVGDLRLKNPVKAGPWNEVLDATEESPKCLQAILYPEILPDPVGQEDCLYLSIYTPNLKPKEKLPVLVHTHGGGFRIGDGGPKDNADYFMDEDVILVNVHYRLGFLSTEDDTIPGNYGLKDQSMALHWVKENIKDYGGDDDKITVFGVSAGGASANYHLLSPASKSILRGGILQSGSATTRFWAHHRPGNARPLALRVAESVGCGDRNGVELLQCLQGVSAVQLYASETNFTFWSSLPLVISRPVMESNAEGAFLTFDPLKQETTLPMITGITRDEGFLLHLLVDREGDRVVQEFIDNMDDLLYKMIETDKSCPLAKATVEKLKARYFPDALTIKSAKEGLKSYSEDAYFVYPMGQTIKNHRGPLYQYLYDYRGGSSFTDLLENGANAGKDIGVSHADESFVMFNMKGIALPGITFKTLPTDVEVSKNLIKLWVNFARHQKPTLDTDEVQWPKYNYKKQYLRITHPISIGENLRSEAIEWWSKLPIFDKSKHVKNEL